MPLSVTVDPRTFRAPLWWWAAGVVLVTGGVVGAFTEVLVPIVLGLLVVGALFLLVAARARVDLDGTGVVVRPNGCRTFRAGWDEIPRIHGKRIALGDRLVTVPPLAGDPMGAIVDQLEHRGVPRPAVRPSRRDRRFGGRRPVA